MTLRGFTLLEVIIAIAIFSLVGLTSFSLFDTILRGDEASKLRSVRQNELQRGFLLLERDISQIARRTMRFNGEVGHKKWLHSADDDFSSNDLALAFVKQGWTNPGLLLPRSELQAVAYRVNDEVLERLHYNFVDAVVGQEPKVRALISQVESLSFQFYDGKKWRDNWPKQTLPLAIAIEVTTLDFGVVRRQFLVPGNVETKDSKEEK